MKKESPFHFLLKKIIEKKEEDHLVHEGLPMNQRTSIEEEGDYVKNFQKEK